MNGTRHVRCSDAGRPRTGTSDGGLRWKCRLLGCRWRAVGTHEGVDVPAHDVWYCNRCQAYWPDADGWVGDPPRRPGHPTQWIVAELPSGRVVNVHPGAWEAGYVPDVIGSPYAVSEVRRLS